jgi:hypothetical protein
MKSPPLFRRVVLLGLLVLGTSIRAADTGPLLRFMSWETPATDLFLVTGKELKPLNIPAYNVSSPVALPVGAVEVRLAKKVVTAEAGETAVVVAQAMLPESAVGALVVLLPPTPDAPAESRRLLVFPDSPADFPAKSIRLINLSGNNSAVRIAGDDHTVPFGKSKITPMTLDRLGRCLVTAAVVDGGSWKVVYKDMLAPEPTQRVTLLLVYSPTGAGTSMSYDEILAGGKRASTQFAVVLLDDVIAGKLQGRSAPDPDSEGGKVTADRLRPEVL